MAQLLLQPVSSLVLSYGRPSVYKAPVSPGRTYVRTVGPQIGFQSVGRFSCSLRVVPRSAQQDQPTDPAPSPSPQPASADNSQLLFSIGIAALWIGFLAYALMLAPNQTPYRDLIFVERIIGVGEKDGFIVNPVFSSLFTMMGVYPAVYASLLVPGGRSQNKVPAWPFVTLSFALGAVALLPYMALWRPHQRPEDNPLPPPAPELEGWNRLFMKGAETPVLPAVLLAGAVYYMFTALTAGGDVWADYFKLFDESRLVHVTSLDFATCTALAPFWMENDAAGRNWDKRSQLLPVLSVLPLVGPCIYLLLRPKTKLG